MKYHQKACLTTPRAYRYRVPIHASYIQFSKQNAKKQNSRVQWQKISTASLKNSTDVSVPSARFSNYGKQRRPPYLLQTLPFPLLDDHQAVGLPGVGLSGAVLLMMILMVLMILMMISKNLHFSTISKHLKGQLDPPVSDGNVFASKQVSWTPPVCQKNYISLAPLSC